MRAFSAFGLCGGALLVALVAGVIGMRTASTATAQDPCSGLVSTRLAPGDTARVMFDGDGLGSALRNSPGKEQSGSELVGNLPEGSVITALSGPVCLDGMVWWRIALADGREFWIGEGDSQRYYIEPFTLSTEVMRARQESPRAVERWQVTYSGDVSRLDDLPVPAAETVIARDRWQPADINAANDALNVRRQQCPSVLEGTAWETVENAADVEVPESPFEIVPAPSGGRALLIRHWVLPIPTCGGGPGRYFGVSTVHVLREDEGIVDLFPYPQHGGTRSQQACLSPDVNDSAWTTYISQAQWSPDSDTVALSVRYLDQDVANPARDCAYYYIFLVDVFNVSVTPVAEGRRPFWGGGGTRLYYFTFEADNAYNVLSEQLWLLSNGQATQVNVSEAEGVQFVPNVFNSTGARLPTNEDGSQILVCNYASGCPEVLQFNIARRLFGEPIMLPEELAPREIASVFYVANDTRLLWRTLDGRLFVQSIEGPDRSYNQQLDALPNGAGVVDVTLVPTGIGAILQLDTGEHVLMNTLTLELMMLTLE